MAGAMSTTCISPSVMPRPIDGLVKPHASPSGTTPVAQGFPSTTNSRVVLAVAAIEKMSPCGSPFAQWAWFGSA